MGCYFPGWGVNKRDGVLVIGMGCYFPGWVGGIWNGVLVNGLC